MWLVNWAQRRQKKTSRVRVYRPGALQAAMGLSSAEPAESHFRFVTTNYSLSWPYDSHLLTREIALFLIRLACQAGKQGSLIGQASRRPRTQAGVRLLKGALSPVTSLPGFPP
jgi:hypothetical protein